MADTTALPNRPTFAMLAAIAGRTEDQMHSQACIEAGERYDALLALAAAQQPDLTDEQRQTLAFNQGWDARAQYAAQAPAEPAYHLSNDEQAALKQALRRSIRVLDEQPAEGDELQRLRAENERLRDEKSKLERAWWDKHWLESQAEAAECVAMVLDAAGVPRADVGGNTYSLVGRVQKYALAAAQAPATGAPLQQQLAEMSEHANRLSDELQRLTRERDEALQTARAQTAKLAAMQDEPGGHELLCRVLKEAEAALAAQAPAEPKRITLNDAIRFTDAVLADNEAQPAALERKLLAQEAGNAHAHLDALRVPRAHKSGMTYSLPGRIEKLREMLFQPAGPVPDGVWEALQRMIEDGLLKGPAGREDALTVARHRDRHLFLRAAPRSAAPDNAPYPVAENPEAVAEVLWFDPTLAPPEPKHGHKIIDAGMAWLESAPLGTKLYAAPVQPLTADYIEQHIGPDEGDREAVHALVREVEAAHGIGPAGTTGAGQ